MLASRGPAAAVGSALGLAACQQSSSQAPTGAPAATTKPAAPAAPATTAPAAVAKPPTAADWASPPDPARARAQAAEFQTFGMPDSWANFGESLKAFCDKSGFTCSRVRTRPNKLSIVVGNEDQSHVAEPCVLKRRLASSAASRHLVVRDRNYGLKRESRPGRFALCACTGMKAPSTAQ